LSDHVKFNILKLYNVKAGEKALNKILKKLNECEKLVEQGRETKDELVKCQHEYEKEE